jgi:hypothetical protein
MIAASLVSAIATASVKRRLARTAASSSRSRRAVSVTRTTAPAAPGTISAWKSDRLVTRA